MSRNLWICCLGLLLGACGSESPGPPIVYTGDATPAWGPNNGDVASGRLLAQKLCKTCHLVEGEGQVFPGAVPFEQTAARQDIDNTYLRGWLDNPMARKPRTLMPKLGLTPEQIEDLIAYIYTLRPKPIQ